MTKSAKLLGYILAQYIDGDDEEPTRTECVDLYIEDALPKYRAYQHRRDKVTLYHNPDPNPVPNLMCFKLEPYPDQDLPPLIATLLEKD